MKILKNKKSILCMIMAIMMMVAFAFNVNAASVTLYTNQSTATSGTIYAKSAVKIIVSNSSTSKHGVYGDTYQNGIKMANPLVEPDKNWTQDVGAQYNGDWWLTLNVWGAGWTGSSANGSIN